MKYALKEFAKVLFGVAIIAFLAAPVVLFINACEDSAKFREKELHEFVYPSWKKAHPGIDLTYAEWRDLHKENLLPK